MLSAAMQVQIM